MAKRLCAYCGVVQGSTRDHVISTALYPNDKPTKGVPQHQRITVPCCKQCNHGWSVDEAHARDVLLLSGPPNEAVHKVWHTKSKGSFQKPGGAQRLRELVQTFEVQPDGQWMVYPARDPRVLRVLRKIIRRLSYKHCLRSPLSDDEIWIAHRQFKIQDNFMIDFKSFSVDPSVIQYGFSSIIDPEFVGLETYWELTFFRRTPFSCNCVFFQ